MILPLGTLAFSSLMLIGWWWFCTLEQTQGRRLFLSSLRGRLDTLLTRIETRLREFQYWCQHFIVRWGWRYSVHTVLRSILFGLSSTYDWLLARFEQNRKVTQQLRRERKRWKKQK